MNEIQFGTIYGSISPIDQQLAEGTQLATRQQFLARGTYQIAMGGQEVLRGEWSPPNTKDALSGAMWAAFRMFSEVQRRERHWNLALVAMRETVHSLTREVGSLKSEILRLQNSKTYVVPLTLIPAPFRMIERIPVTVEGDGESFTATFVEANVSASGETEADAIANLKDSLVSSYEILESMPPDQLGDLPTRQWGILRSIVQRTDGEHHEGTCTQNPR